jgi:hypothetical protein
MHMGATLAGFTQKQPPPHFVLSKDKFIKAFQKCPDVFPDILEISVVDLELELPNRASSASQKNFHSSTTSRVV